MDEDYQKKLAVAKASYALIMEAMEVVKLASPYEVGFCWDECLWVDNEFFNYSDLKDTKNG